jgi:hypothetical protein
VQNYNTLDKVVIFMPGSVDIDYKNPKAAKLIKHALEKMRPAFVVNERCNVREMFKDFVLDEWRCLHSANAALNGELALIPAPYRPFGKWYDHHFGNYVASFYCLHGIYSVSPELVARRTLMEYKQLLNEVEVGSNVEVGHFLERAWAAVFKGPVDLL